MVATKKQPNGTGHTIRVADDVYQRLTELSQRDGLPISKVVAELVREQERREFFAKLHEDALRLRQDAQAWQEYRDELAEWDVTLLDGLEDS